MAERYCHLQARMVSKHRRTANDLACCSPVVYNAARLPSASGKRILCPWDLS